VRGLRLTLGDGTVSEPPDQADWFVSRTGDNSDGRSWATAWNELNQITWPLVQPGHTIALDGGATQLSYPYGYDYVNHATAQPALSGAMVYTTTLKPTASGTSYADITIRASREPGRDGTIVIFGGRYSMLPEAGSTGYVQLGTGRSGYGIDLRTCQNVVIDGLRRSGIMVYGFGGDGGAVSSYGANSGTNTGSGVGYADSTVSTLCRNLEIFDCGNFMRVTVDNTYKTDNPGLRFGGTSSYIDRCLIHDNGQDSVQAGLAAPDFRFTNCWLYYRRAHSVWSGYGFNGGAQTVTNQNTTHVDGIQAYFGGEHLGPALVDGCIFGPWLNQGLYLGDASSSLHTTYDNVTARDSLFLLIQSHPIKADYNAGSVYPHDWLIDHCTVHRHPSPSPGYAGFAKIDVDGVAGSNHIVRNSIFAYGGYFATEAGFTTASCTNNFYAESYGGTNYPFGPDPVPGGVLRDPNFVSPMTSSTPSFAAVLAINCTPQTSSVLASGAGSSLHSAADLMARIDVLNGS
jgi:hypothetical protein